MIFPLGKAWKWYIFTIECRLLQNQHAIHRRRGHRASHELVIVVPVHEPLRFLWKSGMFEAFGCRVHTNKLPLQEKKIVPLAAERSSFVKKVRRVAERARHQRVR